MRNILEEINLSSRTIEKTIKDFNFEKPPTIVKSVEWKKEFPIFSYSFYEFLLVRREVPTQEELWDFYTLQNKEELDSKLANEKEREGLKARIFRTQPSLIRDLHFALKLGEEDCFDEVILDPVVDVEEGIDIIIKNEEETFGLELFVDTKRSRNARIKKEKRHIEDEDINYIELPLLLDEGDRKGDYILYTEEHLKKVKSIILSRLENF